MAGTAQMPDKTALRSRVLPRLNPIERLWELMHKHITHNRCYERFADFRDAMLGFLREGGQILHREIGRETTARAV